jgi:multiple sugar transport system substrate-binding protein
LDDSERARVDGVTKDVDGLSEEVRRDGTTVGETARGPRWAVPQSRRQVLKLAVLAGIGTATSAVLAACGIGSGSSSPASTAAGQSTGPTPIPSSPASGTPVAPISLQSWSPPHEDGVDTDQWKQVYAKWNSENPDIQVTEQIFSWDDYSGPKLVTAFAGGVGPDLFITSPGTFMDLANNNVMAPLDDVMADVKSGFQPAALAAASLNGEVVGIPYEIQPLGLFYRKDYLLAAGVQPPTTWDELIEACKAIKATKHTPLVMEVAPGPYQNFTWYPFAWMGGGDVMNADWTQSTMRSDGVVAALDLWGRLIRDGYVPKSIKTYSDDPAQLGNGETAMIIATIYSIAGMSKFPDVEYGVVPLPSPPGGQPVTVYGGFQQNVSSQSQHIDAAKKFAKWLWVENEDWVKGWSCGFRTNVSPIISVNEGCLAKGEDPHVDQMRQVLMPIARSEPRYPKEVVTAVSNAIQAVQFGGSTGADAASKASDVIDAFLKSYKGYH